jgi:hypothetical protein
VIVSWELMRPAPARFVFGHQPVPRPEEKQDVGRLRDQLLSRLQYWRCVGRTLAAVFQQLEQRAHALVPLARDVYVFRRSFLQRQAHEFAAALYRRPVVKLVHVISPAPSFER